MNHRILNKTITPEQLQPLDWIIWNGRVKQVGMTVDNDFILFMNDPQTMVSIGNVREVIRIKVEIIL